MTPAFPALLLAATLGLSTMARAEPAPAHECDRLAQPPRSAMGGMPVFADGVEYKDLRWPAARAACTKAMQEHPGEVRFRTYAARAADKSGEAREAVRLYRAAADEGDALAQNNLGAAYANGEGGLPRNEREAVRYYRMASDQGFASGMSNLAAMYAAGSGGLARNDREAVRLWQAALESGDVQAQTNLGVMYAGGRGGLPRDMRQAIGMWRLAAEQGSTEATGNLRKAGVR